MNNTPGTQPEVPGLLVDARDIGVRRGERWIIRHVNLRVTRGELVYVVGANGAGKSTCVKAVLGLLDVDEGHVARAPSLEVGYVPQRLPVAPTLPLPLRRLMGLSLGLVVLAFFPSMRFDLHGLLFGDILAVTRTDLVVIWAGGAGALVVLWWLWRPLLAATVSVDLAVVAGLRPEHARLLFGFLVAALISVAVKVVGILLIVALLVIPPATARRFASSPERMAGGAAAAGVLAIAGGLFASATFDTPSGPSIVTAALALFVITRLGRPRARASVVSG